VSETQPIPRAAWPVQPPRGRRSLTVGQVAVVAFTLGLVAGAVLRLWNLASAPDWQYDEGVYTQVSTNVLHGTLAEHVTYGTPWQPFLYQPPLYFLALARWFALTGPSIFHARVLGVLCSLGTLVVLFRLMWRLYGPVCALFCTVPVIFDGWLLYIQRVSYIENALLLLVTVSVLAYRRALEVPSAGRFATAGAVIALTIAVKYTAAYLVLVVLLCWLITSARGGAVVADAECFADPGSEHAADAADAAHGEAGVAGVDHGARGGAGNAASKCLAADTRPSPLPARDGARGEARFAGKDRRFADSSGLNARGEGGHRRRPDAGPSVTVTHGEEENRRPAPSPKGHLVLLATTGALLGVYGTVMYWWFDLPHGQDWWVRQNTVQLRRVLGLQKSGGTLTSPAAAVHLLFAQYRVFAPSFLVAVCAFVLAARLLFGCWRARSWARLRPDALLWSWMAAGVVVFGSSSLRFPQYFALILVPMYCFWWAAVWHSGASARVKLAAVAAAVVLGVGSFWARVPAQTGNPFRAAQAYAATSIPPGAVVVTEEAIGDLISQRWCRVEQPAPCYGVASYAITWKTYLQSSFSLGGAPFGRLMQGAVPLRSWSGFSGTATVWRLR
jgi:Dolichyl-phosphate-mannose-protein mannosyltransferase